MLKDFRTVNGETWGIWHSFGTEVISCWFPVHIACACTGKNWWNRELQIVLMSRENAFQGEFNMHNLSEDWAVTWLRCIKIFRGRKPQMLTGSSIFGKRYYRHENHWKLKLEQFKWEIQQIFNRLWDTQGLAGMDDEKKNQDFGVDFFVSSLFKWSWTPV